MAASKSPSGNPFSALTQVPGLRQLLVLVGLALSISVGVTAAFWMSAPGYSVLFSNVSDKEASEIVNVLTSATIPYQIDTNTGAISVPGAKVREARLKLAEQGLPKSSGFGLEIMEGQTGLGTSQFMEGARYHHALETELARTISSLQPVQSARVHLAVPKSTVFLGKKEQPSASVFLQLYPGRTLEPPQVASIVHLIASSIPQLEASQVTVVDQRGTLLNSPDDSTELAQSAKQLDYAHRIEEGYVQRIEGLLVPMLGPGRIRASVTADVDFTQREETQELYDPQTIVRSEQVAEDRHSDGVQGGIPGALSNQPPPQVSVPQPGRPAAPAQAAGAPAIPPDAAAAGVAATTAQNAPVNESVRRTRNFEMDRTLSHTRQPVGNIRRLSVAVLVDEKRTTDADGKVTVEKIPAPELEEIGKLVRDAVGFDEKRGDSVSISNVAFYQTPPEEAADEPGFLTSPSVQSAGKQGLAALLILAIALILVRPLLRALSGGDSLAAGAGQLALAGRGAGGGAVGLASESRGPLSYDDKVSVARQLADRSPDRVAQIVRAWVQTDE